MKIPLSPPVSTPPPLPALSAESTRKDLPIGGAAFSQAGQLVEVGLELSGDHEEQEILRGAETITALLSVSERPSDIQVRTDRHIRIHTRHGVEVIDERSPRLTSNQVTGILLALWRSRSGARNSSANSHQNEDLAFKKRLEEDNVVDFSCEGGDVLSSVLTIGRLRVQAFLDHTGIAATIRVLSDKIPTLESLNLDAPTLEKMRELVQRRSGICLITGQTGAGKSTTLAALIAWLKNSHPRHIVTIEEPIEFRHSDVDDEGHPCPSLVTQQEVGIHVRSFRQGLISALRKAPHCIMLGEIRDRETMETALEAAATGHVVFGTLHTRSAPETISRIADLFPVDRHDSILNQLSDSLLFVLSQGLLPGTSGRGRVLCHEFFVNVGSESRSAIRKFLGNQAPLRDCLLKETNTSWEKSLERLSTSGLITSEVRANSSLVEKTNSYEAT